MAKGDDKKEAKPKKDAAEKKGAKSDGESGDFFSSVSSKIVPTEDKNILGLIDNFTAALRENLSAFLRKPADVSLDSVDFCTASQNTLEEDGAVLSCFQISSLSEHGLLHFDYPFMHNVIDILFGAKEPASGEIISSLGQAGHLFSERISEIYLAALEKALQEYAQVTLKTVVTSENRKKVLGKFLPEYYFDLKFNTDLNGASGICNLIVPEALFEAIAEPKESEPAEQGEKSSTDSVRKEIIDSSIPLIACLQETTLKIKSILDLKSGDLIPIEDPTSVYLLHNKKKIFIGSAGQSNSKRVVRIEETV